MRVREMRASSAMLTAEVEIGTRDNGGYVTTKIKLDRKRDDVQSAFALLDNVLLREAQAAVDEATRNEARRRREFEARTGQKVTV